MPHAATHTTLQAPPQAGSSTPPQRPVTRTATGPRGCGVARTQGDIYLEFALHLAGAQGIAACLVDPPIPFDQRLWGVPSIGVRTFPDAQGVTHLVDVVGQDSYPEVMDFLTEALRMGVSRKIPGDFAFEELTPQSTVRLVHARAHVRNHAQYAGVPDSHCPKGHQAGQDCLHLMFHATPRDPDGTRSVPAGKYPLRSQPAGVTPVLGMANFLTIPVSHLTLIRHPDPAVMQRQLARLKNARIPVVISDT